MVTTADVMAYLNIPEDSSGLLQAMIDSGYDYIRDAVDDYDDIYGSNEQFKRKVDFWVLHFWMPDAYDQREGAYDGQRLRMNYPAQALLTQIQMYKKED